mgnify:CR=1 FL=1
MQIPDYAAFTKAVAEAENLPDQAFDALCELTRDVIGVKLFTVMTHDSKTGEASRVYSNMPEAYPVSGKKPANETDWSRQVIGEKRTFVANDIEEIAAVFYDHELIQSLGCESCMNVPIVVGGNVLGTINCLHDAGYYTPERVQAAEALKLPGAVCLLLNELIARGGL